MTRGAWRRLAAASFAAACALSASSAHAQTPPPQGAEHTLRAVRIEPGEAPEIDGDLSDAVWAKAAVIDGLVQVNPNSGEAETEHTVLRVLYDENNLYFAVYCYDAEPDKIVLRARARDGAQNTGDYIRLYLDPDMTRRNGYAFDVGAAGGRTDGLLQNNTNFLNTWNTIWEARTRVVSDGWVAEIAIPFRSLSYDPSRGEWGFDFSRNIRRKGETDRWTSPSPTIENTDISEAGTLTGLSGTVRGLGLDLQVSSRLTFKRDWTANPNRDGLIGFFSANAYYKIAQSLTGTVTLNPDFLNSPLDDRQVNTTRFSLFTPETRDFFLQDTYAFEFGGLGFVDAPNLSPFVPPDPNNAQPFFSRNIGLVNGRPVTIMAGGKISGDYDGIGVGALTVRTNPTATTPGQTLSVLRMTTPVFAESKMGFILTNGDPTGKTRNTVAGADFQYHNSRLAGGDDILEADAYYARSFSDAVGDDSILGGAINFPNEPWGGELLFKQVGNDFAPALGFINRPGIRDYEATITERTRYRNQYLRSVQFGLTNIFITGLDDQLQSRQTRLWTSIQNHNVDVGQFDIVNYYESVPAAFALPGGVMVPAGNYQWTNFAPRIDTTNGRAWVLTWQVECCTFYNGSYVKSDLALTMRWRDVFEFAPHYVATWISLPAGYVAIHVIQGVTTFNITPDMQLLLQAQFDNISRAFGFSARYRWEYEPGNEIFVALGQSAEVPGSTFVPQNTQFSVRLGHTFRF